jgi:hypothetical protein
MLGLLSRIKLNKPTIKSQSSNSALDGSISIIFQALLFIITFKKSLHAIIVLVIVCHIVTFQKV